MKRTKQEEREIVRQEAIEILRKNIKPGETLRTILRHESASGMSRSISVVQVKNRETREWDGVVARAIGEPFDQKHGGIKVQGAGMDMGFDLVYRLSMVLYGGKRGYPCLGMKCPSNVHVNDHTAPRGRGLSIRHSDGYALSQAWL